MLARRPFALTTWLAASLTLLVSSAALAGGPLPTADRVSVVVVFDDAVADPAALVARLGSRHGFAARHVYGTALKGFVASVPAETVAALEANPQVRWVEPEVAETIIEDQVVPTGVDRIEVDKNPHADLDGTATNQVEMPVAVIDTGIDSDHPDLNVIGVVSVSGGDGEDKNGHGTHVAGTIGAVGDTVGVVGVAPGAPVYGVQVCKPGGICLSGDIIAGIDHVAQKKSDFKNGVPGGINFASANFSISSADTNNSCASPANATHAAICGLVDEGVVFAMAGGNDAREKDAYPIAFAVAAIADFDGGGGKAGSPTCREDEDDTLANFSNWGVDVAAPGTCILSTWLDGGYNTISGTSMATPHVAGAVAFYLHATGGEPATSAAGVAAIESAILGAAHDEGISNTSPCSYDNERGTNEPLLFVNHATFNGTGACDVTTDDDGSGGGGTLSVAVSTDKPSYVDRETVTITVEVTDGTSAVDAASVHVDISTPRGRVHSFDGTTDAAGTETFSFKINVRRDGTGTYTVDATATKDGATGSDSTSFTVD